MYKHLLVILFLVTVNLISSSQSLPSFRWRRSDSSPKVISTFNAQPVEQQQSPRFLDLTFFQSLPKYVFDRFKRPQASPQQPHNEIISLNSLEKPMNLDQFDAYHSYETLANEPVISHNYNNKPSPPAANKPPVALDGFNGINESYEDDDVIVIPFTKVRGEAFKNDKPFVGKSEQGVPPAPAPIGYDASKDLLANSDSSKIVKKFASKVITDSEDDLETGDELSASLSSADNEAPDFKVQFSDLHPVYVKPPKEFQPIFYPNREIDGSKLTNRNDEATIKPLVTDKNQEIPNIYPNGLSSWILGGYRFGNRGGYWESLLKDESLYGYNTPTQSTPQNSGKKVVEIESNDNTLDFSDNKSSTMPAVKSDDKVAPSLNVDDKLEFISLSEPKSRSSLDDDLAEFKKEKNMKKALLTGKFKSSSPLLSSKHSLLKRKLNLRSKKTKILTVNKSFNKNVKQSN